MTVTLTERAIVVSGRCGVEDVETLVGHLERQPELPVDLSTADQVHTALWQAIMVFRPKLTDETKSLSGNNKLLGELVNFLDRSEPQ